MAGCLYGGKYESSVFSVHVRKGKTRVWLVGEV
jgi:hypothetical protein